MDYKLCSRADRYYRFAQTRRYKVRAKILYQTIDHPSEQRNSKISSVPIKEQWSTNIPKIRSRWITSRKDRANELFTRRHRKSISNREFKKSVSFPGWIWKSVSNFPSITACAKNSLLTPPNSKEKKSLPRDALTLLVTFVCPGSFYPRNHYARKITPERVCVRIDRKGGKACIFIPPPHLRTWILTHGWGCLTAVIYETFRFLLHHWCEIEVNLEVSTYRGNV